MRVRQLLKPVVRKVGTEVRDGGRVRPLVVRLESQGIFLRQKGRRRQDGYLLPYEAAYQTAALLAARARMRT